jgi:hypothetical protein
MKKFYEYSEISAAFEEFADIAIFIEAAKECIQNSGELHDYATTQGE